MTHPSRVSVDPTRVCIDCSGPVSGQSTTCLCRRCSAVRTAKNRAARAKAAATYSKTYATNPDVRARHVAGCSRGARRRMQDPAERARLIELGRTVGVANLRRTGGTAEARLKQTRRQMAWCPEHLWPLNKLLKRKRFKLAERQQIIRETIAGTPEHVRLQFERADFKNRLIAKPEPAELV